MKKIPLLNARLFAILLSAFAVRSVFITGMVRGDALNYAHVAYEFSQGNVNFGGWAGSARAGLFLPVSLLYALFGPSEATTLFFPIVSSLASVIFVFAIARLYGGRGAGLVAALLWAFLPLDIHLASSLLPDAPLAALSTGSVYFLFLAGKQSGYKSRLGLYLLSGLLLLWAILVKPLALITLIFFGVYAAVKLIKANSEKLAGAQNRLGMRKWKLIQIALLLVGFIVMFGYGQAQPRPFLVSLARTASNLSDFLFSGAAELDFSDIRFSSAPLLFYIAPLFLVATVSVLAENREQTFDLLLWLGTVYLYYEWGTINTNPAIYVPLDSFVDGRNMLFLLAPLVVVVGIYLGSKLTEAYINWIVLGVATGGVAAALWLKPILYAGKTPIWLLACVGLSIVGAVAAPMVLKRDNKDVRQAFAATLLLVVVLAGLRPVLPYHALMYIHRAQEIELFRKTLPFLMEHPDAPIYVSSRGNALKLNYATDFNLGFDWTGLGYRSEDRIRVGFPDSNQTTQSFVVSLAESSQVSKTWLIEETLLGDSGEQLFIYQMAPIRGTID